MSAFVRIFANYQRALLVLVAAIALYGVLMPVANGLQDKVKNDAASFLPGDAEAVRVNEELRRFPGGELVPAVLAYRREGGLTAADRRAIQADRERWAAPDDRWKTLGASPLQVSDDGSAATFAIPIRATGENDRLVDLVTDIRRGARDGAPEGLEVGVTGPAGFSADAVKVFANINTTLFIAAGSLVVFLLLIIYRSPIFWLLPIFSVVLAEGFVRAAASVAVDLGLTINGQSQGILLVLVFGVATDYALLLVARYREELERTDDRPRAVMEAVRRSAPAILASAATVVAGLMVLVFAEVNAVSGLGPIGAIGVAVAAVVMLTVLPALLVLAPRGVFWPRVPRVQSEDEADSAARTGWWRRVGDRTARNPRPVWIVTMAALLVMSLGLTAYRDTLTDANGFIGTTEAVTGQEILAASFPAGASAPTTVLVPPGGDVQGVTAALRRSPDVAAVLPPQTGEPGTAISAVLREDPFSTAGYDAIPRIRDAAKAVEPGALVGGETAVQRDVRDASNRDLVRLPPLILLVVFVVLAILLRALVAPLLLVGAVVLSTVAALGASLVFFRLIGAPGENSALPLYAFVFLVALGIDYSIFLMARAREESERHGTREGVVRALAVTGGVITSAGIVLAGTFAVLCVLPLWIMFQVGFLVAFGVLVDALVVRTFLVPALVEDIGPKVWWPSRLAREDTGRRKTSPIERH